MSAAMVWQGMRRAESSLKGSRWMGARLGSPCRTSMRFSAPSAQVLQRSQTSLHQLLPCCCGRHWQRPAYVCLARMALPSWRTRQQMPVQHLLWAQMAQTTTMKPQLTTKVLLLRLAVTAPEPAAALAA